MIVYLMVTGVNVHSANIKIISFRCSPCLLIYGNEVDIGIFGRQQEDNGVT